MRDYSTLNSSLQIFSERLARRPLCRMYRLILTLVIAFVFHRSPTDAKICENVRAANEPSLIKETLKDCTIIVGYLHIVLVEYKPILDHHNITFPDLKEITGYLLIFRVYGLTSLGKLFPNLTVIRGDVLFLDEYALILHSLPDLMEIDLKNLRRIERGYTRISNSPKLCFAETVDWKRFGPRSRLHYFNYNEGDCKSCPYECDGSCWNENDCQLEWNEQCHPECIGCFGPGPDQCHACRMFTDDAVCVPQCPKYKFSHFESHSCITEEECLLKFKANSWVFQGSCISKCPAGYNFDIEVEGRCAYCGDYCKKTCAGGYISTMKSIDDFYNCTHIRGSLHLNIFMEDVALEVERALGRVKEIRDYLVIHWSPALESLAFLQNLTVIGGEDLYHQRYAFIIAQNKNLHELWDPNNTTLTIKKGGIHIYYNPLLCFDEIKRLIHVTSMSNLSEADYSDKQNGYNAACNVINLKATVSQLTSTTATFTWELHPNVLGYTMYYTEDPFKNKSIYNRNEGCLYNSWWSIFVESTSLQLRNLSPYTQYAFYIQLSTLASFKWRRSEVQYFITSTDEPAEPTHLTVHSTTSSSIIIRLGRPKHPHCVVSHYVLTFYLQEDSLDFLLERDYCTLPTSISNTFDEKVPLEAWTNRTCCSKQNWTEWAAATPSHNSLSGRNKRWVASNSSSNALQLILSANISSYEVTSLQHFKIYIFKITACNHNMCSGSKMFYQRTMPKEGADDMPHGISVAVDAYTAFITWPEPAKPNAIITSYILEYNNTDAEDVVPISLCVTRKTYKKNGGGYKIAMLPGQYSARVTAVSLAGKGRSSKTVAFEIEHFHYGHHIIVLLTVAIIVIMCVTSYVLYRYWNKRKGWLRFINSTSVESLNLQGQYEFNLDDVAITNEAEESTFGVIANGFIKSQNRPCTVKYQEYFSRTELAEFLKNSAVIELSNGCYHLVTLIGIVPKHQPPLLITELMAWGDLKSFLRCSKQLFSLTHAHTYRMAAEIADGMAYLASQKFVHCDLAARNCMVSAGLTVKIVNFDIAKDMYDTDYFKDERRGRIPIRWMAPESLADSKCTISSNVWSYGIVLWELVTFAKQPYDELLDENVWGYVVGKNIMACPSECPERLYEIMVACWAWNPTNRPSFTDLLKQLQLHVARDFKLVSFYHSHNGLKYRKSLKGNIDRSQEEKDGNWGGFDEQVPLLDETRTDNLPSTSGCT